MEEGKGRKEGRKAEVASPARARSRAACALTAGAPPSDVYRGIVRLVQHIIIVICIVIIGLRTATDGATAGSVSQRRARVGFLDAFLPLPTKISQ